LEILTVKTLIEIFHLRSRIAVGTLRCLVWSAVVLSGLTVQNLSAAPLRIMAVGDSITVGGLGADWSLGYTFGYRGPLYTQLTNAGYNFQFVAPPNPEPFTTPIYGSPAGNIVGPDLRNFNQADHWGYAGVGVSNLTNGIIGKTNGNLASPYTGMSNITTAITSALPDIVLLMAGINNITPGATGSSSSLHTDLKNLVQTMITAKPDVQVIVAQISPYSVPTTRLVNYNTYIRTSLINALPLSYQDNVTIVDQYANFLLPSSSTINTSLFSNIANYGFGTPTTWGNHPNPLGYEKMADTWFDGIQAIAPVPEPSSLVLGTVALLGLMIGCARNRHGRSARKGA
jgi:lysophospholipase L1-like esterase